MSRKKRSSLNIEDKLDEWAIKLVDRITSAKDKEKPTIAEETGAFKAVTLYYAYKKKLNPTDDDEGKFGGHAQQIADSGRRSGRGEESSANGIDAASPDF